ncbi:MAG: dienelactone hydrolase family protein [Candidatus Latescibacteria bacterium]|nr:dienelactone hydrolase family protein [Candidatus Latescibacterota bacterium]
MHPTLCAVFILLGALAVGAQDSLQVRLNQSPRHQEWVKIPSGDRQLQAFLVFPEVAERAQAVILIHENRGLTDWVRGVADRLAEAGYIALAPDLLSGTGPGGGGTDSFASQDSARQAIYRLPPAQVSADLNAAADYLAKLPAADGRVAVAGFCWGGARAFGFAAERPGLAAAYVFYGTSPDSAAVLARINCPVYGFYGGNDARVNATIPAAAEGMRVAGKIYEPVTYEGAGHGFLRAGEATDASPADRQARAAAWSRWLGLLAARPGGGGH